MRSKPSLRWGAGAAPRGCWRERRRRVDNSARCDTGATLYTATPQIFRIASLYTTSSTTYFPCPRRALCNVHRPLPTLHTLHTRILFALHPPLPTLQTVHSPQPHPFPPNLALSTKLSPRASHTEPNASQPRSVCLLSLSPDPAAAQELELTRLFDDILVMDEGRVIEHGPRHQLLEKRGAYYKICLLYTSPSPRDS